MATASMLLPFRISTPASNAIFAGPSGTWSRSVFTRSFVKRARAVFFAYAYASLALDPEGIWLFTWETSCMTLCSSPMAISK